MIPCFLFFSRETYLNLVSLEHCIFNSYSFRKCFVFISYLNYCQHGPAFPLLERLNAGVVLTSCPRFPLESLLLYLEYLKHAPWTPVRVKTEPGIFSSLPRGSSDSIIDLDAASPSAAGSMSSGLQTKMALTYLRWARRTTRSEVYRIARSHLGSTSEAVGRSFPLMIKGTHLQLESCLAWPMKHTGAWSSEALDIGHVRLLTVDHYSCKHVVRAAASALYSTVRRAMPLLPKAGGPRTLKYPGKQCPICHKQLSTGISTTEFAIVYYGDMPQQ